MEIALKILGDVTIYFSLFYPLLYIKGFFRNNRAFKIFALYLVAIGCVQFGLIYYKTTPERDTSLHLFVYYFVSQFVFLSLFYKELLGYRWIHIVTGLALLFIGYQYFNDPSMYNRYNPIGSSITQAIIVLYTLLYFYKSLSGKKEFVIVNTGIFFYLLSSLLIFASGNLVLNENISKETQNLMVDINLVLFFIFQILIIVEWWRNYSGTGRTAD